MIKISSYFCILLFVIFGGCAEFGRRSTPPPTPAPLQHIIKYSGETLAAIASWYTGDSKNWKRIAEANNNIKPEALKIGMTIEVPMELVSKMEPPPQSHFRGRTKNTPPAAKPMPIPTNSEQTESVQGDIIQQQPTAVATPVMIAPTPTILQATPQPTPTLGTPNTTDELLEQLLKE